MANSPLSDEEWQKLLQKWRALPVEEPSPFFYTRLQARLQAPQQLSAADALPLPSWLRRPSYALAFGAVVLALNVGAVLHQVTRPAHPSATASAYAAFVAEYQLDPFSPTRE